MATALKRNRDEFQSDNIDYEDSSRKKYSRSLPIRATPLRPSRPTVIAPQQPFITINSQMLTPAESSDEELLDFKADRQFMSPHSERDDSQTSNGSSTSSIRAQASEDDDAMDMIHSPPLEPTLLVSSPVIRRSRSNDIFQQTPGYLQPLQRHGANRIATPIRPTFKSNSDIEMADTGHLSMLRTRLSPTVGDDDPLELESGLLSPASDSEPVDEMEMSPRAAIYDRMSRNTDSVRYPFGNLDNLPSPQEQQTQFRHPPSNQGYDGQVENTGRGVPRLHMGYKADCEKCVQRVPGHYSHILWS